MLRKWREDGGGGGGGVGGCMGGCVGGGRLIGIVPKFGCACFKNSGISMACMLV